MKVLLASTVGLAIASGSALAADMPIKAPMAPLPVFSWTGLYLGIEGGWGFGREDYTDNSTVGNPPGLAISQRPNGGIFGGVLGYRYQTGQFVFGAEGTAAWADLTGSFIPGPRITDSFKVRSLYTATGQAGWAFNQALLYVKGGWAGASSDTSINSGRNFANQNQNDSGWTVGVGLDYAAWRNLVLGVEYDHFDLGYAAFTAPGTLAGTYVVTNPTRLTIEQFVGRVTYKFNLP